MTQRQEDESQNDTKLADAISKEHAEGSLLDRYSTRERLGNFYRHSLDREVFLLKRELPTFFSGHDKKGVLSIGCGPEPARGLPQGDFHLVGLDSDQRQIDAVLASGAADEAHLGRADELPFKDGEFDMVIFRLVLHHIAYQGPLGPSIAEASRVLRPGGVMVAVEPGIYHPVGALLAFANRLGMGQRAHGTVDDIPLSPLALKRKMTALGLNVRVRGVTYSWRRLPVPYQKALQRLSALGNRPPLGYLAHTFMAIGIKGPHAADHRL